MSHGVMYLQFAVLKEEGSVLLCLQLALATAWPTGDEEVSTEIWCARLHGTNIFFQMQF